MIKTPHKRQSTSKYTRKPQKSSSNVGTSVKRPNSIGILTTLSKPVTSYRSFSSTLNNTAESTISRKTATDTRIEYLNRKLQQNAPVQKRKEISSIIPDLNTSNPSSLNIPLQHTGESLRKMLNYDDEDDSHLYQSSVPYEEPKRTTTRRQRASHMVSQTERDESGDDEHASFERRIPHIEPFSPHELLSNSQENINPITNLQALSLSVLQNREEKFSLAARPVYWHGLQPDDTMQLPSLEQELPNVDWRTFLDLTQPHLWYPMARMLNRKIIYHSGPTNSGKTHRAMVRLQEAKTGLYCGPLRLLAWENFERLNKTRVPCSLLTGQEVMEVPGAKHVSTTVEMVNMERIVDVAVIDEIQMIQDPKRGFAWTRALLGVPAKEVHICGDNTVLRWLEEITKITGEELHINQYKRLSPLEIQDRPVMSYRSLQKGDCVVAFTRKEVYAIRKKIEEETGKKVAIIYGNLPPAVRKQQAQLFNDPNSGVDILVASDAIGMGLNLNIGRIVFSSITKFDGEQFRKLTKTEVLQIGGRAGRYKSKYNIGKVSVMHNHDDLQYVREQFEGSLPPMEQARLFPSTEHLLTLCRRFPDVKLSDYLLALPTRAKLSKFFTMTEVDDIADLAKVIDEIEMPAYNRVMLCYAPVSLERFKTHRPLLEEYAERLLEDKPIGIPRLTYAARPSVPTNMAEISLLEETYSNLDLYVWLWYRMGDIFYMHRQAKMDIEGVATLIHTALSRASVKELRSPVKRGMDSPPHSSSPQNGQMEEGNMTETEHTSNRHDSTNQYTDNTRDAALHTPYDDIRTQHQQMSSERESIRRLIKSDKI